MINRLGYNIANAMRDKKLSRCELARRMNLHRGTVSKHIDKPHLLTIEEVMMIAKECGVDWRELLEGV